MRKPARIASFAPIAWPRPIVAELHRNNPQNFCPKCKKHWSECGCAIEAKELPNKIAQARPWGWKGAMVLPIHHADHPQHPRKLCLRAVPHRVRLTLDIYV